MTSKSYSDLSVATNKPTLDEPAAFPNIAAIVDRVQQRCALGYFPLRGGLAKKVVDRWSGRKGCKVGGEEIVWMMFFISS